MTLRAWGLFLCLWFATLTAFRRDPAWELVLEAMVFGVAAVSLLRGGRPRNYQLFLGLFAIVVLALGQLILGHTISPVATALAVTRSLALAAWGLTLQRELGEARGRFLAMAVQSAGAFALFSLLMGSTSAGHVYWWWPTAQTEVLGPWVNRNHFAVWCELMLAPAIWLAAGQRQFWWAAAALAAGGAASGSRAALGLMVLELMVLLVYLAWQRKDLRPARKKLAWGLLIFPLGAALLSGDDLWRKLRDPEPLLYRDQMWRSSLTLWRGQPWLGHGLGTFERAYPAAATFDTGERVDHAHNDWLEWGAEGGLVLVAILLTGFVYAVRLTPQAPWLLGVPIVALHALVDYPFARFPLWLWLILLVTLATFERARFKTKPRSERSATFTPAPHKIGSLVPHRIPNVSENMR